MTKTNSAPYSVFDKQELQSYEKISSQRNKGEVKFIDYLITLLDSKNPYMRWIAIKELQILGGQKLLKDKQEKTLEKLTDISTNDHEVITLSKNILGIPQYYISYNKSKKSRVQISKIAQQTINTIHRPSKFREPLFYFEDEDPQYHLYTNYSILFEPKQDIYLKNSLLNGISNTLRFDFAHFVDESFSKHASFEYFFDCIVNHGVFYNNFFNVGIKQIIANEITRQPYGLEFYKKLLLEYDPNIRVILKHNPDHLMDYSVLIANIIKHLTNRYIFAIAQDTTKIKMTKSWWKKYEKPRKCSFCGKDFSLISLPDWMYFGSNGFKKCCFHCMIVKIPKNDNELVKSIKGFLDICDFIPYSNFHPAKYSFSSQMTQSQWVNAIWAYTEMGGINYLRKKYGSWMKCLLKTNALPYGTRVGSRGVYCLSKDGHYCNSLAEQKIDNWLFDNKIKHEKEPLYPYHPELNPNSKKRADWLIGDTILEFFGLPEEPNYAKRMAEKITLSKVFGFKLVAIYPKDLNNLNRFLLEVG